MDIVELQKAIGADPDGIWADESRKALLNSFTNPNPKAAAITDAQIGIFAARLKVSPAQVKAVAAVESSGSGFDKQGRPKILFERHLFHKFTGGRFSVCAFSNPKGGGYKESSWDKLAGAIVTGQVDSAFMSCSWGKFQVLGQWWDELDYASPFAFAQSTVNSEQAHYEMLCRFVEENRLQDEMKKISTNADSCRAFARAYNGPRYEDFKYHTKLAKAMA